MKKNIKQKIIKYIKEKGIFESEETKHSLDRLAGRINKLDSISSFDKEILSDYLDIIRTLNFNKRKSFAIKLLDLKIDEKSEQYVNIKGREYYKILDFLGKNSTGNEIWAIIRNNSITTIMLRKDIQPKEKLKVDYVVNNLNELQNLINKKLIK